MKDLVLLDHLVRSVQHRLRNRKTDLLRRFQVNEQFELRRLLHGQISWLCSSKDLFHENGGPLVSPVAVDSVPDQAAILNKGARLRTLPEDDSSLLNPPAVCAAWKE